MNGLLVTVALFQFNVDTDVFYAWLTQDLLPKISAGTVIVMDNASFHKRTDIIHAIEAKGCIPEFLPTYSPDLNPIEHTWAQLKSIRHHIRCSIDHLFSNPVIGHLFMVL
jgi:transposase